ncbi:dihydrofolate reductase family protein [Angustibacter luteus]|uniref:Dihydrofolate reductase family protein n=1 Tax=Angustibacter luteus TaxID=658456 RepID=A0ABW1JB09_9ACTN
MAKLIYSAIASLDGYVADADGGFDWAAPDEEVHRFVNDLERPIGTYLYGRRMYDVMAVWDNDPFLAGQPEVILDYARIWRAADKVVFSRTLDGVTGSRIRIERDFDPAAVRRLKESATADLSIGGPELAGQALGAGLVDEVHLILCPVLVGGGNAALPADVRLPLRLVSSQRFGSGVVHLHYEVVAGGAGPS